MLGLMEWISVHKKLMGGNYEKNDIISMLDDCCYAKEKQLGVRCWPDEETEKVIRENVGVVKTILILKG